jgi:cell division protein FtsA
VKVKYGSALESKNRADEIVSIPGIKGHAAKEIAFTTLSGIIEARLTEIFNAVNSHIQRIHSERPLNGGIVLTGGGSQMKDITDLLRYITGMDVRIGLPNEHTENTELMKNISNPMYSTGIGLIIESIARDEAVNKNKKKETKPETPIFSKPTFNLTPEQQPEDNTVVVVVDDDDTRTNNDENDDDTSRGKNLWGKMMDAAKKWFDNVAKEVDD